MADVCLTENPSPLGMKDGTIQDSQLTASSEYTGLPESHGPSNARLDLPASASRTGSWSASQSDLNQWIQADLETPRYVTGIVMQGRYHVVSAQWVTRYKVQYGNDGVTWLYVKDVTQTNHAVS